MSIVCVSQLRLSFARIKEHVPNLVSFSKKIVFFIGNESRLNSYQTVKQGE